jgi:branched-chain amino acid aminotransferase
MTIDELEKACYETIDKNEKVFNSNDEHRLMINVSRGPLGLYAPVFDGKLEPTIVIADFPLKWTVAAMSPLFDSGINAVIPNQRAIPAYLMDPKIKNRSRLFYQMANIEVSQMKGENNWALLLDPDGYITEGTGDNFFIVKNGEILTPEGRNILRGVSREYIFEIAKELGIPCKECNIEAYDVHTADEAFMTGTPFCILPTVSLQGLTIGTGKMGEITSSLLERWSKNVGLDIKKQIQDYGKEISKFNSDAPNPYQFKK